MRDLRTGLRSLSGRPLYSAIVVLVLALGIGATTAIFTLLHGVILSPLPFDDPGRLVTIWHGAPDRGIQNVGTCAAWHFTYQDEAETLESLGMFAVGQSVLQEDRPAAIPAVGVTEGVLTALRLEPLVGRRFSASDMEPEASPTIMLTEGYWRSRFGGDRNVVGRTLRVDGEASEIIGVVPARLRSLGIPEVSVVVPLRFDRSQLFVGNVGYRAVARLRSGVTLDGALADFNRVLPRAWDKFPGGPVASSSDPSSYRVEGELLKDDLVGSVADLLWILMAGVALVLIIACANVANLVLVRATGRDLEMSVRASLGASGGRIAWEYLKESLILASAGGALGLAVAYGGLQGLRMLAPDTMPRLDEVSLSTPVLLFTLLVSLATGLVFGFVPALRHDTRTLGLSLREAGQSATRARSRRRAQQLSTVVQLGLALVLMVGAGLVLRSSFALANVDLGLGATDDVLVVELYAPWQEVPEVERVVTTYEEIVHRLGTIPGVGGVALATSIPMAGNGNINPFYVRGREQAGPVPTRRHKWVGEGYFETLGIPILTGRSITWEDIHNRASVAMLSERLAVELFGSAEEALGQYVAARPDPPVWKEVIGVAGDVHDDGPLETPPDLVYWPQVTLGFWEGNAPDQVTGWRGWSVAIRSDRTGTAAFREDVAESIADVHAGLPLMAVQPLSDLAAGYTDRTSFVLVLLGVAGAAALILGLVGMYGVIAALVALRTREIGIRMALGASRSRVLASVVREGAVLATAGVVGGLAVAYGVTRFMTALLFEVSPADPATFAAVAALLLAVALLASFLPARRAAAVDPASALRTE